MLSFFKINDPFRLAAVVLYFMVLASVVLFLFPFPATQPALLWMVLGERLSEGNLLFKDVIDDTGPLSALVFTLIHLLFGRSEIAYEILGRIIILIQIGYWTTTLIRYRVFNENTYMPAIIMAALFHFSFDLMRISPPLLGNLFLMLALGQLFSQTILQKQGDESTLLIGLYGGLASSFYINFLLFLPYIIFTGIVISGFSIRQLFMTLAGFILPILLLLVFYLWNDGLEDAFLVWENIFGYEKYKYHSIASWAVLGIFPLLLATFGFFIGTIRIGGTINQQKQRQLILFWLLFSGIALFFAKRQATYQLLVLIPGLTYLINQIFLHLKSRWIAKLSFGLLTIGLPLAGIFYWYQRISTDSSYFITSVQSEEIIKGKTLMILGNDFSFYKEAKSGGPFLNYHLTKDFLKEEKSLPQKAALYKKINQQQVDIILDQEGVFKHLLQDLPLIKDIYAESRPGFYVKK